MVPRSGMPPPPAPRPPICTGGSGDAAELRRSEGPREGCEPTHGAGAAAADARPSVSLGAPPPRVQPCGMGVKSPQPPAPPPMASEAVSSPSRGFLGGCGQGLSWEPPTPGVVLVSPSLVLQGTSCGQREALVTPHGVKYGTGTRRKASWLAAAILT